MDPFFAATDNLADDLAWSIESGGDDIIGEALGSKKDDLGANHIAIR